MDSLKPHTIFPIVRGIPDHTDSGTYYIRAVIRKAVDNTVIATVNLVDKGGRYFVYNWEVPADVSGEGFYISIVTSVYTDSGYTTKADMYADEFYTYLVAERPSAMQLLGAGGGSDISYKRIEDIVSKSIKNIKFPEIKPVEVKDVDLSGLEANIASGFKDLIGRIKAIIIPAPEKVDYDKLAAMVTKSTDSIISQVKGINIPEFKYQVLDEGFSNLMNVLSAAIGKMDKVYSDMKSSTDTKHQELFKKFEALGKIKNILAETDMVAPSEIKSSERPKPVKPWYRK